MKFFWRVQKPYLSGAQKCLVLQFFPLKRIKKKGGIQNIDTQNKTPSGELEQRTPPQKNRVFFGGGIFNSFVQIPKEFLLKKNARPINKKTSGTSTKCPRVHLLAVSSPFVKIELCDIVKLKKTTRTKTQEGGTASVRFLLFFCGCTIPLACQCKPLWGGAELG